jgi:hypothetical protein
MTLRHRLLTALAAAAIVASAPALAEALRFKVSLTHPMRADAYVKLEPGDYDVAFEPSPQGPPHFVAVFFRGGARVATAPAELKGAPAGTTVSDIKAGPSLKGTFDRRYLRKDGSIQVLKFEVKARSEKAFYEALITEIGMPALDGDAKSSSKSPNGPTPKPTVPKATPTK